jgi:hypothetical protein
MSGLKKAAEPIADHYPFVHDGGDYGDIYCFHCGRDVTDYHRSEKIDIAIPDRRAHEPECEWVALRDALGMNTR